MASRSDTVFPLIPAPMALAVDTISSAAASARRSPVPSKSARSPADRRAASPTKTTASPTATASASPMPAAATSTTTRAKNPRHPVFNEDIFSKFYTTPFMVFHFALYGAVPFYYLLHYSPFRDFGSGAANEAVKWFLFILTQYITAVIVTSWGGRYRVHKDVAACALMLAGLTGGTLLKALFDGMAGPRGWR
ncbi:hypothetical protein KVR01_007925 [Diaporthe batatas]|uniref:uncharacterized protein n=1 Tax=Diaporthe batatas TaxID=748121 RepID=UPI001D051D59|nr:uncharacterized protein KVR01_007925 [Diaporthe batatas]KAG8162160.1 hypothetical protein KVR01_007925 [Diaporthe batatas]